ncbi:MAG TPA: heme-binding domain-containing protein [Candidatus Sulfomarinibacteraceae bacterium]|nr:heme-binding domain-containing protein [Candidatus Sulfomarinibacteraceae bacterium]
MKRAILIVIGVIGAVLLAIQLVPVERSNPPVLADFDGPAEVEAVFRASCYDCHSHETAWPWYGRVAPVSWLVAHDVEEARSHLNFSLWASHDAKRKAKLAEEIWEEVEKGEMPLRAYLLAHPGARLDEAGTAALRVWAEAMAARSD